MTIRLKPMAKDDHMAELLLNSKVLDISGEYNQPWWKSGLRGYLKFK